MSGPYVVRPGEGRVLDLGNFEAVVLADEPATAGAFTVLQTQGNPAGSVHRCTFIATLPRPYTSWRART